MLSFFLFIIASILVISIVPIGITFEVIRSSILNDRKYISEYWRKLALSLDQLGNVGMSGVFNLIMIKRSAEDLFGNPDETISSVIGKNKLKDNLSWLGRMLDCILEYLDPGHSIKSIEN